MDCRHLVTKFLSFLITISIAFGLAGCSAGSQKELLNSQSSKQLPVSETQSEDSLSSMQAGQSITLPDGKLWDGSAWNGLTIQLSAIGLSSDSPITSILGNHVEILSQEQVTVNSIPATLVLAKRSQTAAEEEKTSQNIQSSEYWLIQNQLRAYPGREDMKIAYALTAAFQTSASEARANILTLAAGWKTD